MSESVGLVSFPAPTKDSGKTPYSKALKNLIDFEARNIISKAYFQTEGLLKKNADKLKLVRYK